MDIVARTKNIRVAPRKMRLVADSLSGKSIQDALVALSLMEKRSAQIFEKLIKSAVSNATVNNGLKEESLVIKTINVGDGQALKRFRPSTRGRVHPYKKRGTNVTVTVSERGQKSV